MSSRTEVISGQRGEMHYPNRRENEPFQLPVDMVGRGSSLPRNGEDADEYITFKAKFPNFRVEFRMYPDIVEGGRRHPDPRNLCARFRDGELRLHKQRDEVLINFVKHHPLYGLGLEIWDEETLNLAMVEAQVRQLRDNFINPEFVASLKRSVSAQDFAFFEHIANKPTDITQEEYERRQLEEANAGKFTEAEPRRRNSEGTVLDTLTPTPIPTSPIPLDAKLQGKVNGSEPVFKAPKQAAKPQPSTKSNKRKP